MNDIEQKNKTKAQTSEARDTMGSYRRAVGGETRDSEDFSSGRRPQRRSRGRRRRSLRSTFWFDKRRGWSRLPAKHSRSFFLLLQLARVKNSSPPPSLFLCFSVYISARRGEGSTSGLATQPCGGEGTAGGGGRGGGGGGGREGNAGKPLCFHPSPSVPSRPAIVSSLKEDWTRGSVLPAHTGSGTPAADTLPGM